jgi:hypothetical protein
MSKSTIDIYEQGYDSGYIECANTIINLCTETIQGIEAFYFDNPSKISEPDKAKIELLKTLIENVEEYKAAYLG